MPVTVNPAIQNRQTIYIHLETTNQSFLDMHYYLKKKGIKNNSFFLALYDPTLAGVDPRDPNLTLMQKQRILRECTVNYWYYLREVVRIPTSGAYSRYRLDRGSLAMNYLFVMNCNMYVELPRQFGKTTTAVARYSWVYNFGSSNTSIMFMHKDHSGSKDNLKRVKDIRDALPSYLQMSSATGIDGKKLKVPNTVVTMQHPLNNNKIITFASARSRVAASNLGRGATTALQYWDEFAWILFNDEAYGAAIPAYSKAKEYAKLNHAPYGLVLTSTPGDLTSSVGKYAYSIRNNATPWDERYYDYNFQQFEELKNANQLSSFFLVRFTYKQLGKGMEYFNTMCKDMNNDWPRIRREVLLEWAQVSTDCPFKPDDLDIINQYCHEPIRTILFGRSGQYHFQVYEDVDLRYPPLIGVDPSGATHHDSSAITCVDSRTTKVFATFNCNYIPSDDLADILFRLVTEYMPNAVINIERNGGFGKPVIDRLRKSSAKKNLYYEIKEQVLEDAFDGYRVNRRKQLVKVYGTDSGKEVRNRMIDILFDRVTYHKDKFIAPILHDEMATMVMKVNGKIEHNSDSHDDQVFSYLHALRPLYDNAAFLCREFGIRKFTIKTDEDIEVVDGDIESSNGGYEVIDIDNSDMADNDQYVAAKEYLNDASRAKMSNDFEQEMEADDNNMVSIMLSNKLMNKAYSKKYNVKEDESRVTVRLPDNVFMQDDVTGNYLDEEEDMYGSIYKGNLSDRFRLL